MLITLFQMIGVAFLASISIAKLNGSLPFIRLSSFSLVQNETISNSSVESLIYIMNLKERPTVTQYSFEDCIEQLKQLNIKNFVQPRW